MVATLLQIGSKFGKLDIDQLSPDPKTISRNTASMARDLMKKQVEKVIPIFGKFGGAITVDFWTDDYQKNSFLTITGHYIDNSWNLQNILIGLHHWEPGKPQTGENIRRFLYEKLREFGLEEDLVARNLIFVTDEGGNLRVALNRQCRLNCSAHVLNTALKNSFKNVIEPVTSVLDSCNALVSFIRKSHIKAQLSKTVKPDVDTRWHSKIDMIESILDVFDELEMILSERDELHRLDGIEKATLATLLQLLKPFRVAILQMETSSGYPTLPLVIPVYQMLSNALQPSVNDVEWVRTLKNKLRENVQRKLVIEQPHNIATILHPSFRQLLQFDCVGFQERRGAMQGIRQSVPLLDIGDDRALSSTSSADVSDNMEPSTKRTRLAADSLLDQFCQTPEIEADKDELDIYLAEDAVKVSFADVLQWWKTNSDRFPKLAFVARKFLAVPATSAASESVFRYGGLTVTELRNRLCPETICNLLFSRHFDENA